jgi:uncharacterized protein (DUF1800 family)
MLKSSSAYPIKFDFTLPEGMPKVFSFSPSRGHLGPKGKREIVCTFSASEPVKVDASAISVALRRIEYKPNPALPEDASNEADEALWGKWDDSMKNVREASEEDIVSIEAAKKAVNGVVPAMEELREAATLWVMDHFPDALRNDVEAALGAASGGKWYVCWTVP